MFFDPSFPSSPLTPDSQPHRRVFRRLASVVALVVAAALLSAVIWFSRSKPIPVDEVGQPESAGTLVPAEPEPSDPWDFYALGIRHLRAGEYDRAVERLTKAITGDPRIAVAYTARGFAYERTGKKTEAEKDLARAELITAERRTRQPILRKGDPVTTIRPVTLRGEISFRDSPDAPDVLRSPLNPGACLTVVASDGDLVQIEIPSVGKMVRWFTDRESLALGHYKRQDAGEPVPAQEVPSFLARTFLRHQVVAVSLGLPTEGHRDRLNLVVSVFGYDDGEARIPCKKWHCELRSADSLGSITRLLVEHERHLRLTALLSPQDPELPSADGLGLLYDLPRDRILKVGAGEHLFLSRAAQAWLEVSRESGYSAKRHILIGNEPHWFWDRQVAMDQGLAVLFRDNPHLSQKGGAIFLVEGCPSGTLLDLKPLVDAAPRPDEALVKDVLRSFLVPGQVTFAWRHQPNLPILGNEDPVLYRISSGLWANDNNTGRRLRETLWVQAVAARNLRMARTAVDSFGGYRYPFLFFGGKHLDALEPSERLDDAWWRVLDGLIPKVDYDQVKQADKRGVADYLKDKGVGFTFLDPRPDPFLPADTYAALEERYRSLMQAQTTGDISGYVRRITTAAKGTTTAPDPKAAASLVLAMAGGRRKGGDDSGGGSFDRGRLGQRLDKLRGELTIGTPAPGVRVFTTPVEFAKLPKTGTIDPKTVRFSQDSISPNFKDGTSLAQLIENLKADKVNPNTVTPIRIVEKDGRIYTLDNRRLKAFQEAGVPIRYEKLDAIPEKELFKFTTKNEGIDVEVRRPE